MTITGSQRIVVSGLGRRARGDRAHRSASRPRAPSRSGPARSTAARAVPASSMDIAATATGVVIVDSTFLHCSSPFCIRTFSPDVLIQHNTFDDLDDSDAVHGFGGGVIRANHMDHALPHGGRQPQRLHPDRRRRAVDDRRQLVRRAHGWRRLDLARSDQRRADPRRRDREQRRHRPLRGAVRRHLRGRRRHVGRAAAAQHHRDQQHRHLGPLELAALRSRLRDAARRRSGRWSSTTRASGCSTCATASAAATTSSASVRPARATDVIGNPHLDANGAPTAASTLLIDHGDPSVAPANDFFGFARTVGVPDIGAIEFGASAAAPAPVKVHAAAALRLGAGRRGASTASSCACGRAMPRAWSRRSPATAASSRRRRTPARRARA